MRYPISYDLRQPGQNYATLVSQLKKAGAKQVLLSAWAVSTTWNATQICNWVRQYTDLNDRIVVTELQNWGSYGSMTDINLV